MDGCTRDLYTTKDAALLIGIFPIGHVRPNNFPMCGMTFDLEITQTVDLCDRDDAIQGSRVSGILATGHKINEQSMDEPIGQV